MMLPMRFTLITITYNAEKHLAETLQSVADQDFSDFEHLIWDGGSKDKTLDIARSFEHVTIYEGKDSGIADAMNRASKYAKGEFLIHLHADDLLFHSKVLSMIDTCLKQHPTIDWLYGKAHFINAEGKLLRKTPFEPFTASRLKKYNFITHPAVTVRRALFEEVGGFQTHLRYCMDYDLWLRLTMRSEPFSLSSVVACFREHDHSLSTSEPLKVADEAYQVRNVYVGFFGRLRSWLTWKKRKKRCLAQKR